MTGYNSGLYFKGIPMTIKAVAETGYRFVRWEGIDEVLDTVIFTPLEDTEIKAIFELIE